MRVVPTYPLLRGHPGFWFFVSFHVFARQIARKTARSIATSAWWRTGAWADKTAQRTVLYLGEINDQQQAAWRKTLEVFDETAQHTTLSLFPEDRPVPADAVDSCR